MAVKAKKEVVKPDLVEVTLKEGSTHTAFITNKAVYFVEGKATVTPELAERLEQLGIV